MSQQLGVTTRNPSFSKSEHCPFPQRVLRQRAGDQSIARVRRSTAAEAAQDPSVDNWENCESNSVQTVGMNVVLNRPRHASIRFTNNSGPFFATIGLSLDRLPRRLVNEA